MLIPILIPAWRCSEGHLCRSKTEPKRCTYSHLRCRSRTLTLEHTQAWQCSHCGKICRSRKPTLTACTWCGRRMGLKSGPKPKAAVPEFQQELST